MEGPMGETNAIFSELTYNVNMLTSNITTRFFMEYDKLCCNSCQRIKIQKSLIQFLKNARREAYLVIFQKKMIKPKEYTNVITSFHFCKIKAIELIIYFLMVKF